jgi:DNA-binding transcriptional ArsR family regulator
MFIGLSPWQQLFASGREGGSRMTIILGIAKLGNIDKMRRMANRTARPQRPAPTSVSPDLRRVEDIARHAAEAANLLKLMGNEKRLLILCSLVQGPLSVGELNSRVDLSQSALSQHLALLRECGLVETVRESQSIVYSLPRGPVTRMIALLQDIYCPVTSGRRKA